jgi:hypothetical protein
MTAPGIADLPLVSGHPALDLLNTVEPRLPVAGRHEHLIAPRDALTWALRTRLADPAEGRAVAAAWAASPAAADRALTAVRQTREALSAVLSALLSPPGPGSAGGALAEAGRTAPGSASDGPAPDGLLADLEYLSVTWAAAASRSRLAPGPSGGAAAQLLAGSSPALLIPDRVARAAVELLCDTDLTHLGTCPVEAGGCGWVYIDRSRNRSRRWCTMDGCGTHAKARRLTERRRAARSRY